MDGKTRVASSTECPKNWGRPFSSVYLSLPLLKDTFSELHSSAKDSIPKASSTMPPKAPARRRANGFLNRRGHESGGDADLHLCRFSGHSLSVARNLPNRGSCSTAPQGRRDCYRPEGENGVTFAVLENDDWRSSGRVGGRRGYGEQTRQSNGTARGWWKKEPTDEVCCSLSRWGPPCNRESMIAPLAKRGECHEA